MDEEIVINERQLVVFSLDNEMYGVDISHVQEIVRFRKITKVPKVPVFVEGVINLRGNVIPIIDLRKRFGFDGSEETNASRIIVVEAESNVVGMIVDSVSEVVRVTDDLIEPPSDIIVNVDSDYLTGVCKLNERLIILLDLSKVLSITERNSLIQAI